MAWRRLRESFRRFRINRIVEACAENGSFRPEQASLLRAYLNALKNGIAAPAVRPGSRRQDETRQSDSVRFNGLCARKQTDANPEEFRAPRGVRKSWKNEPAGWRAQSYGDFGRPWSPVRDGRRVSTVAWVPERSWIARSPAFGGARQGRAAVFEKTILAFGTQ